MILIIDDDIPVCESAVLALEMEGFEAGFSSSFKSARTLLSQARLVFLDITMPEVSGIQALEMIRKDYPELPVVMFTGVSDLNTAVSCMKIGAVDYLVKPVEPEDLCACALEHLPAQINQAGSLINFSDGEQLKLFLNIFDPETFMQGANDEGADLAKWLSRRFADSDCTLRKAARELGTNTTYLSRIVSRQWNMSFRHVLNLLRLAAFIRLATQKPDLPYSMDNLAREAGWHKRSTFYGAVKYLTGLTPAEVLSLFQPEK